MSREVDVFDMADGFDVVGLGALNVDLISAGPGGQDHPIEDSESLTTSREILDRVRHERLDVAPYLGGSAFNAMAMLAQLGTGLRLGMVGVSAGAAYGMTESHVQRMRALGITDLTYHSEHWPGLCSSLSSIHGRILRTAPESNLEIADYLANDDRVRLAASSSRVLHVTSLLENPSHPRSTEVVDAVSAFIQTVKLDNPELVISFDPGQLWVERLNRESLCRIFALSDVVFTNGREFSVLTGGADTGSSVRARSVRHLCPASTLIILKSIDEIVVQHAGGFDLARVPRDGVINPVDPTGAGDAVAAGVLAALGLGRSVTEGCQLGLRIASHRVADFGDLGHRDLRDQLGGLWPAGPQASQRKPPAWS